MPGRPAGLDRHIPALRAKSAALPVRCIVGRRRNQNSLRLSQWDAGSKGRRMLLIPTKALKEGMQIAQPVFHPKREEIILLEPGFVLTGPSSAGWSSSTSATSGSTSPTSRTSTTSINPQVSLDHMMLYQELRGAIARSSGASPSR